MRVEIERSFACKHVDDSLFKILPSLVKGMERITMDIFGGVAAGLPNDTLVVSGSGPFSFDGSFRRFVPPY